MSWASCLLHYNQSPVRATSSTVLSITAPPYLAKGLARLPLSEHPLDQQVRESTWAGQRLHRHTLTPLLVSSRLISDADAATWESGAGMGNPPWRRRLLIRAAGEGCGVLFWQYRLLQIWLQLILLVLSPSKRNLSTQASNWTATAMAIFFSLP